MKELFEKWEAEIRVPEELRARDRTLYEIMERINSRYFQLDTSNGDFNGLSENEKLSKLIEMINQDSEISELNALNPIGSIKVERQKVILGRGPISGLNLCIGEDGLFIFDWHNFQGNNKIPATPDSLAKYLGEIKAEGLKEDVIKYTNRRNLYKERQPFL